jgi:DNA (cytosine-5)-methyltransferase 3A
MKVLSLFDGISCGMVALERVGIPVERYVAYEIDEDAIKVSKHNYPFIEQKGDVFKGNFSQYKGFDLVIGGSPCTHWSIARCSYIKEKRETTFEGIGANLFMQYVRALEEVKPKYFLYENNSSMSEEIKNEITKLLGVEPIMIDSASFSAQKRLRLYWTNIPIGLIHEFGIAENDTLFSDIEYHTTHEIKSFEKYAATMRVSTDGLCYSWDTSGKGNYSQQNRARVTSQKWNTLPSSGNDKNNIYLGGYNYRKIHPIEAERLQTLPDNYTACIPSAVKRTELCGNGWTVDVIAYIFKRLNS